MNAVSASGDEVYFSNLGGFGDAGDDSSPEGTAYVATRESRGWVSESLEPPAAGFVGASGESAEDVSSKRRQILSLRIPASAKSIDKRFYINEPGGAAVEVGPVISPTVVASWTEEDLSRNERPLTEYAGASPDLSHVLFLSTQGVEPIDFLWPGDEGVASQSLYEYVGREHAAGVPQLVGVSDGTTKVDGVTLPEGALISQCGTLLGGLSESSEEAYDNYNSVSEASASPEAEVIKEEAARVFFTAKEGGCVGRNRADQLVIGSGPNIAELYARINGMRTVDISEPSAGDCSPCDTSEADQPGAQDLSPTFVGASRTGSKVFFTTTQKLFPAQGDGVNLYEYDFNAPAGAKVSLVGIDLAGAGEVHGGVMRISEDGSRVYFVSTAALATNPDAKNEPAEAGHDNLYVYDTDSDATRFIAALSPEDATRDWPAFDARQADATSSGDYIVFGSVNDLTRDATGTSVQIYRYDAESGVLERINLGDDGMNSDGNAPALLTALVTPQYSSVALAAPMPTSIAEDGTVAFESSLALTPNALNNACASEGEGECLPALNVYEYEAGHVYLISDGQDTHDVVSNSATQLIGLTPSGSDLFFETADQLVAGDTDTQQDIYDARIDGGFPSASASVACHGDGCQGPLGAGPGLEVSASVPYSNGLAPSVVVPAVPVKAAPPKQNLSTALKACRKLYAKSARKKRSCEAEARRKYGLRSRKKGDNASSRGRR